MASLTHDGGVRVQHLAPGPEIAPEAFRGIDHRTAPEGALAAFCDRTLQISLPGFLGLLSGSAGLSGLFCGLYAAFKLCNFVRKLAICVFF